MRGTTLLDLLVAMMLSLAGVSAAVSVMGSERLTSRAQETAHRDAAAAAATLHRLAGDLREAVRVAPRHAGPGAVVFLRDGAVAVWFDRPGEPGVLYRKVLGARGARGEVVARGIDGLVVAEGGTLVTARVQAGLEDRVLTIRRRP